MTLARGFFLLNLCAPAWLAAQTGEIRVTVQDPSGSAIPRAAGSAENLDTHATVRFQTGALGAINGSSVDCSKLYHKFAYPAKPR